MKSKKSTLKNNLGMREELITQAIAFLQDEAVASSPLSKKMEFLEKSKGLTAEEVQEALKRSVEKPQSPQSQASGPSQAVAPALPETYYETAPPLPARRDWKDFFIIATATAGVGYALYELGKRYVVPQLLPESKTKLEQDKTDILNEFARIDTVLKQLEEENKVRTETEVKKLEELEATVESLNTVLKETKETKEKLEDEYRNVKREVNQLQISLDKFISQQGSEMSSEVSRLREELESLKNLAKNEPRAPLPGASAVKSASEILKNFPVKQNESETSSEASVPEWKKGKSPVPKWQQSMDIPEWQKNAQPETGLDIPEWQKSAGSAENAMDIPDWQQVQE